MRSINNNIANRKTNIRIIEKGVHITTVQNVYINYSQDYESLKKMIEISIRLSPQSPVYIVEEIKIYTIQGTNEILTQSELELFQSSMVTRPEPGVNLPHTLGNTISLTVSVQSLDSSVSRSPPQSRSVSRSHARIARTERSTSRSASSSRNRDDSFENAKSPYRRDPSPRAPRIANPTPTRLRKGDMLPPSSVKSYNSDRRDRKLADIEGIWNDTYSQDEINERRSTVNDQQSGPDKAVVTTTVLASMSSPKGNVSFQSSSSEQKENSSSDSCEEKLLSDNSTNGGLDAIGIEPETIKVAASFSEDDNDDEEEEGYLTAEEGVSQIERTLQDLESCNETKEETNFGENNEHRASTTVPQALTTLSFDLSSCSQSITDITLDCAIVDGCNNTMSYEWQDIYPETPERSIRISSASTDNQNELRSPSGLVKSPLKSPDRPSDAFKSANQAKRGSKVVAGSTVPITQPRPAKTTVYLAGNIPTTKKERAAAASTRKRIAAATAAAQAAAVANHCYYSNSTGGNTNPNRNSNSFQELSPGFSGMGHSNKSSNGDGRPSIGTITEQWEFMRINFVNNSDEELEWLMVSKRPGAYKHAHKKNQTAEDKYFKSLYDIDKLESRQQFLQKHGPKILAMNGDIAAEYTNHQCNKNSEVVTERLMALQKTLRQYIDDSPVQASTSINEALAGYSSNSQQMVKDLCMESEKPKMITLARKLNSILPTESTSVHTHLSNAKKESDEALRQMEKWAKRETETDDYASVLRDEEMKWFHKELEQNTLALITMRTYIPSNIAELSVNDLVAQSKTLDGLLSMELAQELKTNKLLHWVITHPDDIAFASFLTGDKKSYFENLEVLDIIELRAISICLPQKFELDNDGKKNEWRSRFMQRVRQLVSQQNREKIKGPWDETSGKRKMIELPPLKQDLERRPIYYYRTKEQSALKLKGYDDKYNLLQKKEGLLKKAEEEYVEAKKEYDTILLEMRDPDFKLEYGIEKLAAAKDLAKSELKEAETKRKNLTSDIARLRKTIADQPITRDQFYEMEQELTVFLAERGIDWALPSQSPTMIEGMFDPSPEIKKIERVSAKFSSAEEEAALRKKELTTLKQTPAPRTDECLPDDNSFLCASFDSISIGNTESNCSDSTYVPAWRLSKDGYPTMSISASMSIDLSSGQEDGPMQTPGHSESDSDSNHARLLCNSAVKVGGKRNSILASANQEMLSTLNKMFSPPSEGGAAGGGLSINLNSTMPLPQLGFMAGGRSVSASRSRTPSTLTRRGSVAAIQSTVTAATVDDKPKEPKKSQSKLLKKLLEPEGGEKEKKAVSRPGLSSFLDQVKAAVHSDGAGCSGAAGGPPMSLLQQIQQAKKQKEEASKQQENKENAGSFANTGDADMTKKMSSTFSMGGGGGGAVSFLDAIKSRRVE